MFASLQWVLMCYWFLLHNDKRLQKATINAYKQLIPLILNPQTASIQQNTHDSYPAQLTDLLACYINFK